MMMPPPQWYVTYALASTAVAASVLDLPPAPQFSPAEKQRQTVLGAALPAKVLAAYAAGASSFQVPPGDYRWPAVTTRADIWPLVFASLRRPADSPFTIDASGATFFFETRGAGFEPAPHVSRGLRFVNCSNLILRGLTTDFDPPNTIEGRVTAIDRTGNRLQVELSTGSLFRSAPPNLATHPNVGRFIPYKSSGEFITPLYSFQNNRGLRLANWTGLDNSTQQFWATLENSQLLTATAEPGWRHAFGSAGQLEVGDAIAIMYAVGTAMEILESESVTVSGWKNYAAKTGLEETLGEGGHRFEHLVFGKRPLTNRLMGGEGVMSNACRKGSQWRNVSISLTTDDLFNFHGYWGYISEVDGHLVAFHFDCLRPGCFTARSTGAVRVGDRVNWRRNTTMELQGSSIVTEVINATLLRFDNDVSAYGAELVAEFPDAANAGWYQRLLVQSGPGEIVNNTFIRVGASISIRSTVLSRNEGGNPRGIIVANNTLVNVSLTPGGGGCSSSPVTVGRLGEHPVVNYSDIEISGNKITLAGGAAIFVESGTNLTIRDNTLTSPCVVSADVDPEAGSTARQAVFLSHVHGATLQRNVVVDATSSCKVDAISRSVALGLGRDTSAVDLDGKALPPTDKSDVDAQRTR